MPMYTWRVVEQMEKAPPKTKPPRSACEMSVSDVRLPMVGDHDTSDAVLRAGSKATDQSSSCT